MEDFYDDIDYEISFSDEDKIVARQCLAIYKSDLGKDVYEGTGIIVSKDGMFVSVSHNFKDKCSYKAFFRNRSYNIQVIYTEYSIEHCSDLFIGKLLDFSNTDIPLFGFSPTYNLQIGTNLRVCGYKSTLIGDEPIHQGVIIAPQLKVNQYCIDTHIISRDEWINRNYNLYGQRHGCTIVKYIDINTDRYGGLSGGPVYSDKGIHGILIADLFLPSEYIIKHFPKINKENLKTVSS